MTCCSEFSSKFWVHLHHSKICASCVILRLASHQGSIQCYQMYNNMQMCNRPCVAINLLRQKMTFSASFQGVWVTVVQWCSADLKHKWRQNMHFYFIDFHITSLSRESCSFRSFALVSRYKADSSSSPLHRGLIYVEKKTKQQLPEDSKTKCHRGTECLSTDRRQE